MSVLGKPQQCCKEIRMRAGTHIQCKRRAVMTHHGRVVLYYCARHQPATTREAAVIRKVQE